MLPAEYLSGGVFGQSIMRRKDDLSDLKTAIEISNQQRFKKNAQRLSVAIKHGADVINGNIDRDFVGHTSDKELQNRKSQSDNELFPQGIMLDKELQRLDNQECVDGEILQKHE